MFKGNECVFEQTAKPRKEYTGNLISHAGKGIAEASLGLAQSAFVFGVAEQITLSVFTTFFGERPGVRE